MQKALSYLVLILIICGCSTQPPPAESTPTPTLEPARDFTLETLSGEAVTLSDLQGQWVLVNFWATWCPPCVAEMPYLQQLANERDMVVLGVNFQESPDLVAKFVKDHNITFPILLNPDDTLLLFYKARSLPRTFVIAPDGTIALQIIGPIIPEQFDSWLDYNLPKLAANKN